MKPFEIVVHCPAGSLLIGGHAEVPVGLHGAHARDGKHSPIIPATALRGALREALEALLRGAGRPACAAGSGLPPEAASAGKKTVPCTLAEGERCTACRLFGSQRDGLAAGERQFSALVLGAASLDSTSSAYSWTTLPGVARDRSTRSAADERLFFRRVPAPSHSLRFVAEGRLLDETLAPALQAAVNGTKHLGSGRSRGLGRVELDLRWLETTEIETTPLPPGDIRLRVTLRSPASIGAPIADDNLRDTRREIPGAALRGAIGFALAEMAPSVEAASIDTLVDEHDGAHFGFLFPVDDAQDPPGGTLPITAAACKFEPRTHGTFDTLLDKLAAAHVTETGQVRRVEETSHSSCRSCGAAMRSLDGWRRRLTPVPTRGVTRVSIDRTRSSARDEHLFTQVMLEEGTTFEGTIRNIPAASRELLARALAQPLSLGRGRASGWGCIDVHVSATPPLPSLVERGEAFDAALRRRLTSAELPTGRVGRLVPVTLLSPLVPDPASDDGSEELARTLDATCFLKLRRFSREGGWDQRAGVMSATLATAAGAVFVLELGVHWRDLLARLAELERRGIGARRHQGFGHVICFDPLHRSAE